jgi:hypothetical protein
MAYQGFGYGIAEDGAVDPKEPLRFFNNSYQSASISMRSAIWG